MIDEYFLLVKRVNGINMSIDDFWNTDSNTFYHLLNNELKIIEEERKEQERQRLKNKNMKSWDDGMDQDYLDIYEELENQ